MLCCLVKFSFLYCVDWPKQTGSQIPTVGKSKTLAAISMTPGISNKTNRNLLYLTITSYFVGLLTWTLFFYRNPYLKNVLVDIHLIFSSTIACYLVIRLVFSLSILDFIKVFIRTLFRVWLLIFITFAISRSMDRIGFLLSLTFIFGYIEGLLDINKWLESNPSLFGIFPKNLATNKMNHAISTIFVMNMIHILCAIAVLIFYTLFLQLNFWGFDNLPANGCWHHFF